MRNKRPSWQDSPRSIGSPHFAALKLDSRDATTVTMAYLVGAWVLLVRAVVGDAVGVRRPRRPLVMLVVVVVVVALLVQPRRGARRLGRAARQGRRLRGRLLGGRRGLAVLGELRCGRRPLLLIAKGADRGLRGFRDGSCRG